MSIMADENSSSNRDNTTRGQALEQQPVYQTNLLNNGEQQYYVGAAAQNVDNVSQIQQQQIPQRVQGGAQSLQSNIYEDEMKREEAENSDAYDTEMNGEGYEEEEGEEEGEYEEEDDDEYEENDAFANVGQGLTGQYKQMMMQYWQEVINNIEREDHDFKNHQLPLARIKKVMKTDEAVRMISAEAPILFAKCCDIFITELTMRAWIHAEENKRRTLQKSDICAALQKSDMFDFLIDIVPREPQKNKKSPLGGEPNPQ